MNKTAKAGTRTKAVKKRAKPLPSSEKPDNRFIRQSAEVIARLPKPRPQKVPLAEVEVIAAAAIKKIKATKKLTPEQKAARLACLEESLDWARNRFDGMSRAGVSIMKHAHEPPGWCDLEAVLA
jgi:methylphosphotriester-DNA--protein-cysteine methyltransferase